VAPSYFSALGTPIIRGRPLAPNDRRGAPLVAVVNERFAVQLWPGEDPMGKRFRSLGDSGLVTVVGVARNGKYRTLAEERPMAYYWLASAQHAPLLRFVVMVRSSNGTEAAIETLRHTVADMDPNVPLFRVNTLEHGIAASIDGQRAGAAMLGVAGVLALALAALGIFGVIAHGVTTRTREIGIRMSLGARAADVMMQFVREGLRLTAVGAGVGLALGMIISKLTASFLFGLAPTDLFTVIGAVAVMAVAALVASVIPARRAARVDPMIALRAD
jgi:ABC-type antimicrobial peptide transport system permease subunit